jgi:hypothetical protein
MSSSRKPVKKSSRTPGAGQAKVYTLEVFLVNGPVSEKFAKKNPESSRTIQIRGDQSLEDLHNTIFDAYDRDDQHMYEFQFGKKPMDPKGPRYVLHDDGEKNIAGLVSNTNIESLKLNVGDRFGYWFDFGDDWWHQINVEEVQEEMPKGKYPKVTKKVGESPPQYLDADE